MAEGVLQDVFPGGATSAAAKQHGLDATGRCLNVFFHAPPLLTVDFEAFDDDASVGKVLADRFPNPGRALQDFGFDTLDGGLEHAQRLAQGALLGADRFDMGLERPEVGQRRKHRIGRARRGGPADHDGDQTQQHRQ